MIYDSLTLAACIHEMKPAVLDAIVHQVRQPSDLQIDIVLRAPGRQSHLLLSAHPRYARAHLTGFRDKAPQTPPHFCQILRKRLEGTRVESVQQEGLDRILRIKFRAHDGESWYLVHEIMGKHSNLVLLDSDSTILSAIKIIGPKLSRVRQIMPGRPYQLPPSSGVDPRALGAGEFQNLWQDKWTDATPEHKDLVRWLVREFAGISPVLAEEALARAGDIAPEPICNAIVSLLNAMDTAEFRPVLIRSPHKAWEEVYPLPLQSLPAEWQHARAEISDALDATSRAEILRGRVEDARAEVLRHIARAREALENEAASLEDVVANPDEHQTIRQTAEILAGHFHQIRPGMESIELPDYYDPEMNPRLIPLQSDLSPQQNIDRIFRKARKSEERVSFARERLPFLKSQMDLLDAARQQIDEADSAEEIKERRQALQNARLIHPQQTAGGAGGEERPFGGKRIRSYTSRDGLEILVGETAEANDYLTTRVARPDDIWMHARQVTGAHVVIRMAGVKQVPQATLREAAELAARNSDAKHSSYIPVDWTLRKHVRKPRRTGPGFVTYTHEKTIDVTK